MSAQRKDEKPPSHLLPSLRCIAECAKVWTSLCVRSVIIGHPLLEEWRVLGSSRYSIMNY